jgi:hypothetical protein
MKTQFREGIKPIRPTFPVPGGPYNRTPDLFGNLEEKRCLYIRGNCIPAKKKDKLAVPNLQHQLLCSNYNNQILLALIRVQYISITFRDESRQIYLNSI